MRNRWFAVFAPICLLAAGAASSGQTPRFGFENRPKPGQTVRGSLTIRVSADPYVRPRTVRPAVTIDGEVWATCDSTPWQRAWDLAAVSAGEHVIRLVFLDSRTKLQTAVDELRVVVRPGAPEYAPATNAAKPAPRPAPPVQKPEVVEGPAADPPRLERAVASISATSATSAEMPAVVRNESKPLAARVSVLAAFDGLLAGGASDGTVLILDMARRTGRRIQPPAGAGVVRALALGEGTVWWLAADANPTLLPTNLPQNGPAQPDLRPRWLVRYQHSNGKLKVYDLHALGVQADRLAVWRGQAYLFSGDSGSVLDDSRGEMRTLDSALPPEALSAPHEAGFHLISRGGRALLAAVGRAQPNDLRQGAAPADEPGWRLTLWRGEGGRWKPAGAVQAPAGWNPAREPPAMDMDRVAVATPEALILAQIEGTAPETTVATLPSGERVWSGHAQTVLAGGQAWRLAGRTLFRARDGRVTDAFLAWNEPGASPLALACDGESAWVATAAGIRRVAPETMPDSRMGYGGFVRVRLGAEAQSVPESAARLAEGIRTWQDVPYKYGGESRQGVDCSGFVMRAFEAAGIALPHGSDNLRTCRRGQIVHDELRYGDVLVYPGHCAIYVGEGLTAETAAGRVGGRSIWFRTEVVVRRFLDAAPESRGSLASRSAKPRRQSRKSSG